MKSSISVRRGFTLVELLVVLAVIGVLLSLTLPAVMKVRATARRTQCTNQLAQLGIALHSHHAYANRFPAAYEREWSWVAKVLPFVEQRSLHQTIDFNQEPFEPPNNLQTRTPIPTLACPCDPRGASIHLNYITDQEFGHTNFLGSGGSSAVSGQRGMFVENEIVRLADVRDGASNTLFVGERPVIFDGARTYGWWAWGSDRDTFLQNKGELLQGEADDAESVSRWWSFHPNGANFLLVDGSVRFIPYSTDKEMILALTSKAGGELVESY